MLVGGLVGEWEMEAENGGQNHTEFCQEEASRDRERGKTEDGGADKGRLAGMWEGQKIAGKVEILQGLLGKGKRNS